MSEDVNVRTVSRGETDGLFEIFAGFIGGAFRMGLTVASVPLALLPRNSRRRVRRAMAELARAIVALPREMANVSVRVVDDLYAGGSSAPSVELPSTTELRDRARAFTERLARAADEFGTSVTRVAGRTADNIERGAAKVDEWVEKKN